jgi:hypothetical protein
VLVSTNALLRKVAKRASVTVLAYTPPLEALVLIAGSKEVSAVAVALKIEAARRTTRCQRTMARFTGCSGQITHSCASVACKLSLDTGTLAGVWVARAAVLAIDACETSSGARPIRILRTVCVRGARWFDVTLAELSLRALLPSVNALTACSTQYLVD